MKCLYCEKEFTIKPTGVSGGHNRQFCYDCVPEGIGKYNEHSKYQVALLRKKIDSEKEKIGCSKCGYNKNAAALEWHHPNDDKEYNPSNLISSISWDSYNLYRKEISKCVLLCANCHREEHNPKTEIKKPEIKNEYEDFRQFVIKEYVENNKSITMISNENKKDPAAISKILKFYDIPIRESVKKVAMCDKKSFETIREFNSLTEASNYLNKGKGGISHISDVCNGKRKTAYGYYWRYC